MLLSGRSGEGHHNDYALRHKVRNLRAKVKLLLPMEQCGKYSKRTKNMNKIQRNRELYLTAMPGHWQHTQENIV